MVYNVHNISYFIQNLKFQINVNFHSIYKINQQYVFIHYILQLLFLNRNNYITNLKYLHYFSFIMYILRQDTFFNIFYQFLFYIINMLFICFINNLKILISLMFFKQIHLQGILRFYNLFNCDMYLIINLKIFIYHLFNQQTFNNFIYNMINHLILFSKHKMDTYQFYLDFK